MRFWCDIILGLSSLFIVLFSVIYLASSVMMRRRDVRNAASNNQLLLEPDAEERAQSLFRKLLTERQLVEYDRTGRVSVPLPNGHYARIGYTGVVRPGLIQWPDTAQCIYPKGYLPPTDRLIGQLLSIREDPNKVRAVSRLPPLDLGKRSPPPPWIQRLYDLDTGRVNLGERDG